MEAKEAISILERYRKGESTATEIALVEEWYKQLEETGDWQWGQGEREDMEKAMEARLLELISKPGQAEKAPVRHLFWRRIAVAASILLVVGLGSYFVFFNKSAKQDSIVKTTEPAKDVKAPETNRAMITLASGQVVYLDSADNGTLAQQGNIKLVKLANGQIAYQTASGEVINEIKYNTLNNPRGSKVINMTLADGTVVWLNAGSSVTFPVAFVGTERKVSITGEAYFEVSHDASKPFIVSKGDMNVTVLGTHFNVNAYDDEQEIKVTLLEGSVSVSSASSAKNLAPSAVKIKPGEQAIYNANSQHLTANGSVDLEPVMAWKNGLFNFDKTDLGLIMRQIERWYDMQVEYQGGKPNITLSGIISRDINASKVLEMLEMSGVHFTIEGKKIIVKN